VPVRVPAAVMVVGVIVVAVAVMVIVVVIMDVVVRRPLRCLALRPGHGEAPALEHAVAVGMERASRPAAARPRHALAHARLVLREGVKERRHEHVAGNPADGVEMNLHRVLRRGVGP
jgi:hypothetical protein